MTLITGIKEKAFDIVKKAAHYNGHPKGYECIDVIEDAPNGLLFNALKYLWRVCWGNKGDEATKIQDLEKSVYYTQREIANRKAALANEPAPIPATSPRSNAHG